MTPSPKYLKPLLVVSVLFNVFLIGGVGGGLYQWLANTKPAEAVVNQHGLRQAMVKLPPERRKELRQLLRQNRADSQPLVLAGREARLDVIKQLEAPTLDREALVTDLGKAREADMALRALVDNTLAQFASTLPRDERQRLVEALYMKGHSFSAQAAGLELGLGSTSDSTMTYRLGLTSDWDKSWWQTDTGRVTGYWSGAYTYWDGDKRASVSSLSFSPVFVYEFAGERVKPYIEAGVGVAVFSRTRVEDNNIGQAFQFEDRLGFGLRFVGGSEVGIRATHYSNAGISSNNDGVESYSLHYTLPL